MQNEQETTENEVSSDENEKLLHEEKEKSDSKAKKFTKSREITMTIALLGIQFLALCSDGLIFPFFPTIAVRRGISNLAIGVVFAAYDTTRFLTSPLFGSLVSLCVLDIMYMNIYIYIMYFSNMMKKPYTHKKCFL